MASILDKASRALDLFKVAMNGLEMIGQVAKNGLGRDEKLEALTVIARIVDAIREGFTTNVDIKAIEDEIAHLRSSLAGNDAAVDSELDKKFPR